MHSFCNGLPKVGWGNSSKAPSTSVCWGKKYAIPFTEKVVLRENDIILLMGKNSDFECIKQVYSTIFGSWHKIPKEAYKLNDDLFGQLKNSIHL